MASIVRSSNTAARCIFATRSTANFHLSSRNTFSVSYVLSIPSQWRQYSTEQDHNLKDKLDRKLQIYTSTSDDPYLNLSIEHYLMEKSDPESTVLFLYQNRPCVVFGRNQNPWLEVNLSRLGEGLVSLAEADTASRTSIDLVRRRSGGGTVYHDEGNINWSIICPPAVFDRDRHAEMVVRALHRLGVKSAQVNDRHDIVIHGEEPEKGPGNIFKVSGSAYKLTRKRALHHGTCLLSSHNLPHISALLRSFAEPFIKARGVESVRSKIRNVHVPKDRFIEEVVREFQTMYVHETEKLEVEEIGRDSLVAKVEAVQKGMAELKSPDWIFLQTPQFTFSTHPTEDDPRPRPEVKEFSSQPPFTMAARHGVITEVVALDNGERLADRLVGKRLHEITDWTPAIGYIKPNLGDWLNKVFGVEYIKQRWLPPTSTDKANVEQN